MEAESKIKFAIVGCGRIAERHAEHISRLGKLTDVCDIVPERVDDISRRYGANAFYDITEMLEKSSADVVSVCTPNGLHAAHSIAALNKGFHVVCEKPMAIHSVDCREMIKAAENSGKNLFVIKQNRYNPPVAAVKKLLEDGSLGRVFSFQLNCFWNRGENYYRNSWKGTKDMDGGTLFTQFSHFIDLLYWMFGDVLDIEAYLSNYAHRGITEFEDSGVAIMRFENGINGAINYTVNAYEHNMEGSLTIFGEKGTVKIGGEYLNELEYQQIANHRIENLPAGNPPNNYGHYTGSMSNHDKVYANVVNVLKHNAKIDTTALDGLKTVEIIERIYQKAKYYE